MYSVTSDRTDGYYFRVTDGTISTEWMPFQQSGSVTVGGAYSDYKSIDEVMEYCEKEEEDMAVTTHLTLYTVVIVDESDAVPEVVFDERVPARIPTTAIAKAFLKLAVKSESPDLDPDEFTVSCEKLIDLNTLAPGYED